MNRLPDISPRQAAVVAGVGYLAVFVLAIFANFVVREGLVDPGDAAATFENIAQAQGLFRVGVLSFLVVFILDVVIAWALFILFRPVSNDVSLLSAWFRLVYTVFLGVALVFMLAVLTLVGGADDLGVFDPGQLQASVSLLMDAFNHTWLVGLAAFGVHLILMAYLLLASGRAPRLLGVIVGIAGASYVIDTTATVLMPNYAEYAGLFLAMVAVPAVIGELWLGFWLLLRAGTPADGAPGEAPAVAS
jgi:hypothetical protein